MLEVGARMSEESLRETTPQVFLIARPSLDLDGMRGYLESVGGESWLDRRVDEAGGNPNPGEALVEFGGRLCYRSWEPGLNPNVRRIRTDQAEYFANILRSQHGSVLEHANYSLALRNVSRTFTHELVRHRAGGRGGAAPRLRSDRPHHEGGGAQPLPGLQAPGRRHLGAGVPKGLGARRPTGRPQCTRQPWPSSPMVTPPPASTIVGTTPPGEYEKSSSRQSDRVVASRSSHSRPSALSRSRAPSQ